MYTIKKFAKLTTFYNLSKVGVHEKYIVKNETINYGKEVCF